MNTATLDEIESNQKEVSKDITEKTYKTFWQRIFAAFVDGLALMIIGIIFSMIVPQSNEGITALSTIIDNSVWLIYSIYLHGRYGQTLGKKIFKITVVNTNGEKISFFQAFKRDVVYVVFAIASLLTFYTHKEEHAKYNESLEFIQSYEVTTENYNNEEFKRHLEVTSNVWSTPVMWIGFASMLYFFLEVITMLTNKKRRAIHDFIAGTEVRRLEQKNNS
jgi:uncharacterized RDD family membrane protein YckC